MQKESHIMIAPLSLDIYLRKRQRPSSDKLQEALAEFSYTAAVQGSIRCGDVEAIVNDDGIVIGYKR